MEFVSPDMADQAKKKHKESMGHRWGFTNMEVWVRFGTCGVVQYGGTITVPGHVPYPPTPTLEYILTLTLGSTKRKEMKSYLAFWTTCTSVLGT